MIPYSLSQAKLSQTLNFIVASAVFGTKSGSADPAHICNCPSRSLRSQWNQRVAIDPDWPPGYDSESALLPCPTTDFICYDAVRPAIVLMFAARTGADCLNWSYFHWFCCGLFAARTAPSDTII